MRFARWVLAHKSNSVHALVSCCPFYDKRSQSAPDYNLAQTVVCPFPYREWAGVLQSVVVTFYSIDGNVR